MGKSDPVSFSRGKRGIAGSLVFTNFDRSALYDVINTKSNKSGTKSSVDLNYYKKVFDIPAGGRSYITDQVYPDSLVVPAIANYPDQIPPFKISITAANELGSSMRMGIFGVELLNQGQGISVDDMVTESQFTFVARVIVDWAPVNAIGNFSSDSVLGTQSTIEERVTNTQAYQSAESYNNL